MDDLMKAQLLAAVRAALYIGGTIAVSLGHHVPNEEIMTEIAGAATVVIAFVWSLVDKHNTAAQAAPAQPPQGDKNATLS